MAHHRRQWQKSLCCLKQQLKIGSSGTRSLHGHNLLFRPARSRAPKTSDSISLTVCSWTLDAKRRLRSRSSAIYVTQMPSPSKPSPAVSCDILNRIPLLSSLAPHPNDLCLLLHSEYPSPEPA